jgi:hypothetical protein
MPILSDQDFRDCIALLPGSSARAAVREDVSLPVALALADFLRLDAMY